MAFLQAGQPIPYDTGDAMAFAGYPLLVDGEAVGVLAILSSERLREPAVDALDLVAQEIAIGLERKRAEQALRDSEDRYRRINRNHRGRDSGSRTPIGDPRS